MEQDKEWLKEAVKKSASDYPTYHDERDDLLKKMVSMHEVLNLIDNLDETNPHKELVNELIELNKQLLSKIKELEPDPIDEFTDKLVSHMQSNAFKGILRSSIREFVIKNGGQ